MSLGGMLREAVFLGAITTGSLLGACASRAPVARPVDPALRPDMEALLREREEFFAEGRNVGATSSARHPTRTRLAGAGSIPTKRVARIDAMAFNRKPGRGPACAPEEEPFARDGGLCGDVRLPVATLTEPEKARVLRLLDDAEEAYRRATTQDGHYALRAVIRCDFDPHHAFVLYDDAGRPVGTIDVCLTCHQWLVRPASVWTGRGEAVALAEGERKALASILDDHGLGAWIFDEEDPRMQAVSAYERALYGTEEEPTPRGIVRRRQRLEATPSGVARTKRLSELTRGERAALCRWTAESVRPGRRDGAGHGYECANGTTWLASYGEEDCGVRLLPCSANVGELEACLRELREPEDLCGSPAEPCKSLMQCLPGLVNR